uniref:poly(A)-specific ribonuclease n=1 Tax=Fagus sylvatica TaxID=28930 RepID=A0A2N9HDP3_FAGSY
MAPVSFSFPPLPVVIREVWQHNLEEEFHLIKIAAMTHHMVSMDTEFPGVVYRPANVDKRCLGKLSPVMNYQIMKENVNATNIIQLGLALCDDHGNLPNFGTMSQYVWQFNFSDFDVYTDLQNTDSIDLLKRQGIDFDRNLEEVFDMKNMMKFCDGLYGGLENLSNTLGVQRVAGKCHQAGSDTLLTMQTFRRFLDIYFKQKSESGLRHNGHLLARFQCVLHGLEPNNYFDQFNGRSLIAA